MGLKFANFGSSTIATVGGISAGDTTVDVQPGHGALFPSLGGSDYFYCVLVDTSANREVVKVTARATDALTIERGEDGTTPRAFAQDDVIELRLNQGAMEALRDGTDLAATAGADNFLQVNSTGDDWDYHSSSEFLSALGITATLSEINTLDGVTATASEINQLDGVILFVTSQELGAPAATITVSGLDGDTHKIYEIDLYVPSGAGGNDQIGLRFNADSTQGNYNTDYGTNGAAHINVTWTTGGMYIGNDSDGGAARAYSARITAFVDTNATTNRRIIFQAEKDGSFYHGRGHWTNVADNITNIVLARDSGNFPTGTIVRVKALI